MVLTLNQNCEQFLYFLIIAISEKQMHFYIKTAFELSRGEVCVANFIPPANSASLFRVGGSIVPDCTYLVWQFRQNIGTFVVTLVPTNMTTKRD